MAAARIKRRRQVDVQQTEFVVPLDQVLNELLNPGQVNPDDKWQFVGNGDGLTIIRYRNVVTNFDINGDPIP